MSNAQTTRTPIQGMSIVNNVTVTGSPLPAGWAVEHTVMGSYCHEAGSMRWSHSATLVSGPMSPSYSPWGEHSSPESQAEHARWVCHGNSLEEHHLFTTQRELVQTIQASTSIVSYCQESNTWSLEIAEAS